MEVIADLSSALREHQGGYPLPPILLLARRNQRPTLNTLKKSVQIHAIS